MVPVFRPETDPCNYSAKALSLIIYFLKSRTLCTIMVNPFKASVSICNQYWPFFAVTQTGLGLSGDCMQNLTPVNTSK